jgi:hypothetical protein
VWNYTSIDIPAGVDLQFIRNEANTPVVWLARSNVTINGRLNLNGQSGLSGDGTNQWPGNEAQGGPGGFAGGLGGLRFDQSGSYAGTAGQAPGGGLPGVTQNAAGKGAARYGNACLQPLIGGSGGGGAGSGASSNGGNGGGGGGALYISSSRDLVVNGEIYANGGGYGGRTGGGAGGAIRLQADRISGNGTLSAYLGPGYYNNGEYGRIRLEAFLRLFNGTSSGTMISSVPVTNQNFAVTGNLLITGVAGQNVVQPPRGSTQNPDVVFTASGPIDVTAAATNIPDGTPVVFRVLCSGRVIQATNTLAGGRAATSLTVPAGATAGAGGWGVDRLVRRELPVRDARWRRAVAPDGGRDAGKAVHP